MIAIIHLLSNILPPTVPPFHASLLKVYSVRVQTESEELARYARD